MKKEFNQYLEDLSKPDEELVKLMGKLSVKVESEKKESLERRIKEEQEKSNKVIDLKVRKELNIEDTTLNESYSKLLLKK